jgi:hypothetical protein
VLYWFRTPPGVRVGRAALDEDAIRLIEEHNPEIDFDWTQILRGVAEAPVEPPPQPAGVRPQGRRQRQQRGRPEQEPSASGATQAPIEVDIVEVSETVVHFEDSAPEEPAPVEAAEELQATFEPLSLSATLDEYDATLTGGDPVPAGGADDFERPDAPPTAAAARLGPEGLLRLRARYAEVLARISERIADPVQQEQLKAQAERLNPDTWVTDQEVRDGLEQYETVFDSLRAVVGRRRTRRRRRHHADGSQTGSAGSSGTD